MKQKPKEEKREPLVIDRFLAEAVTDRRYWPRAYEQLRRTLPRARRFVFDEAAASRIADLVIDAPEWLVREFRFARAPYDISWIEWPSWYYWKRIRERTNDPPFDEMTADFKIGYLFDHDRVNVIIGGTRTEPMQKPQLCPLQYHIRLRDDKPHEDMIGGVRMHPSGFDGFAWGSSFHQLKPEERGLLREFASIGLFTMEAEYTKRAMADGTMREMLKDTLLGSVGEIRTIIALLLVLNRESLTQYVREAPKTHGWIKNKHRPFLSHTVVTLHVDPVPIVKRVMASNEVLPRRRHEVRGYYRKNKEAHEYADIAGCLHEWGATDAKWKYLDNLQDLDAEHWVCTACGGKMWWTEAYARGKSSEGFVVHDGYEVKP